MVDGDRSPNSNWDNMCSLLSYKDRIQNLGAGYSSVVKCLPSMYKALGSEDTHQWDTYVLSVSNARAGIWDHCGMK